MTLEEAKIELEKFVKLKTTMRPAFLDVILKAEPIRRGHWIRGEKIYPDMLNDTTYGYWCSECHHADVHGDNVEVPYCWHCGAKMDSNDSNALNALEMDEVNDETK